MKNSRVRLLISGDVTGVGFRYWTRVNALKLDLGGYVKNTAWVEKVEVRHDPATGEFETFEIKLE